MKIALFSLNLTTRTFGVIFDSRVAAFFLFYISFRRLDIDAAKMDAQMLEARAW
jgi:hypothetical protein